MGIGIEERREGTESEGLSEVLHGGLQRKREGLH